MPTKHEQKKERRKINNKPNAKNLATDHGKKRQVFEMEWTRVKDETGSVGL